METEIEMYGSTDEENEGEYSSFSGKTDSFPLVNKADSPIDIPIQKQFLKNPFGEEFNGEFWNKVSVYKIFIVHYPS